MQIMDNDRKYHCISYASAAFHQSLRVDAPAELSMNITDLYPTTCIQLVRVAE